MLRKQHHSPWRLVYSSLHPTIRIISTPEYSTSTSKPLSPSHINSSSSSLFASSSTSGLSKTHHPLTAHNIKALQSNFVFGFGVKPFNICQCCMKQSVPLSLRLVSRPFSSSNYQRQQSSWWSKQKGIFSFFF